MRTGPFQIPAARRAAALALVACLAVLGACSSDDDGASDDPTEEPGTTTAPEAEDSETDDPADETTTTTAVPSGGGGDLVGTWVADADDLFASNTANVGGAPEISCDGPITLEFTEDGSFAQRGEATCEVQGMAASITLETTATYASEGGTITITGVESSNAMTMGGASQPAETGFEEGASAAYEVDGDTLTITFTNPTVGTVTQTYQRS